MEFRYLGDCHDDRCGSGPMSGQNFDCWQCAKTSCGFKYRISPPNRCYFAIPAKESQEYLPDWIMQEFPFDKAAATYLCQKYNARLPFFTHDSSYKQHRKMFYNLADEIFVEEALPEHMDFERNIVTIPTDIRLTVIRRQRQGFHFLCVLFNLRFRTGPEKQVSQEVCHSNTYPSQHHR